MSDEEGMEMVTASSGTLALLNASEIDMQIATAHKYPRSIKRFRDEVLQMVTLNETIAGECIYALPRREKDKETGQWVTKNIEGPSARFAEIVVSSWGNSRAGARIVSDEGEFVTAQGVMHDLEKNVAITYEVQRRIVDSNGRRYKPDMIGVTANAASSIALRNAILKVVPKAFWNDMYQAARQTIMGDFKTLANRRSDAMKEFQKFGVQPAQLYAKLGVAGLEDVTLEHLLLLRGLLTSLRDGDTTPEQAFAPEADTGPSKPARKSDAAAPPPPPASPPPAEPEHKAPPPPQPAAQPPAEPERQDQPAPAQATAPAKTEAEEPVRQSAAPGPDMFAGDEPEQQAPADGDLAKPSECAHLLGLAKRHSKDMRQSLDRLNLVNINDKTLMGITKTQWAALRQVIVS